MNRLRIALLVVAVALWSVTLHSAEERVLYEQPSAYNTILVTEGADGLRTLRFERDGARQSVVKPDDPDHLELPYARAILAGLAYCPQAQRVLVVGLGGGTIPSFLRRHFPELAIDVVELDPAVFEVAQRYFGFREDARMRVVIADGREFLASSSQPYDLVFLDAFGRDSVPYRLTTQEFLEITRRAVTPRGAVVSNLWSRQTNRLHDAMVRTYQEVFAEVDLHPVPQAGNEILIARPQRTSLGRKELVRQASELSRQRQFPFDLGAVLKEDWDRLETKDPKATVLSDAAEPDSAGQAVQ